LPLFDEVRGWFAGRAITATSPLPHQLITAVFIRMNSRKNQIGGIVLLQFKLILIAALLAMSSVVASEPVPAPPGATPQLPICRPIPICLDGYVLDIRTCSCRRMDT
jgi:hypothetical protein